VAAPTQTPDIPLPTPVIVPVAQRLIWFAPLPPMPQNEGRPFTGSDDFIELFSPDAAWGIASSRINVFKLYGEWVAYHATDDDLGIVVADLQQRGIALGVEAGPLLPSDQCGEGVEGFAGLGEGLLIARRIQEAGGRIDFIALDEPYFYAHIYDGLNACHWTAEQVALAVNEFVKGMRSVFPAAVIGDIEPLPLGLPVEEYMQWMEAYRQVTGGDLDFLHLDLDYHDPTWSVKAFQLEEFCRSRGIPFGVIYNGEDTSNAEWINSAWERAGIYEQRQGGQPDHVVFQSWNDHPDSVLPENEPESFTHLINRYFRSRSLIQADLLAPEETSGLIINGNLLQETGQPVPNAPILGSINLAYAPSSMPPLLLAEVQGTTQAQGEFSMSIASLPDLGTEVLIHYPGSESNSPQGDAGYWPDYHSLPTGAAGHNIAFQRPAVASATLQGSDPAYAVDGNPGTSWSAGDFPQHFVEISLEKASSVAVVRLWVDQSPAGKTIHWIWGKDSQGVFHLLQEVGIVSENWDVIDVWPETAWDDLVAMRIETVQGSSWVAWREIEIITP